MRIHILVTVGAILMALGWARLAVAKNAVVDPATYPDYVKDLAHHLGTSNRYELEAALIKLSLLPPDAFAAIKAEADDDTLDARAAEEFKKFIAQQEPWQEARLRVARKREVENAWNQTTALAAYEKSGKKDPKWDDLARDGIKRYVAVGGGASPETRKVIEQAIEAGCDDPFVVYLKARLVSLQAPENGPVIEKLFKTASDAMVKSSYPPIRKLNCYHNELVVAKKQAFNRVPRGKPMAAADWNRLQWLMSGIAEQWPLVVQENPPQGRLLELAEKILAAECTFPGLCKPAYDMLAKPWEKATPDSQEFLTFSGYFYVKYAWDARGGGWANSVTEQGWKLMGERLDTAGKILTSAWEKDHTNTEAAAEMITVELGRSNPRQNMEVWYRRAMEADPDNKQACTSKMYYLEPKWHGSPQDMIAFAHELYATQNWRTELPFELVSVYDKVASYTNDSKTLWETPEVWDDLQSVYLPYLKALADNTFVRSRYCYYACRCGHWEIARKQFDLLGDQAIPRQFGGEEAMKDFRKQAEKKNTSPATP